MNKDTIIKITVWFTIGVITIGGLLVIVLDYLGKV
jgi:hypothetical protein